MYRNINYLVQTFDISIYMYNIGHTATYKYKDTQSYTNIRAQLNTKYHKIQNKIYVDPTKRENPK